MQARLLRIDADNAARVAELEAEMQARLLRIDADNAARVAELEAEVAELEHELERTEAPARGRHRMGSGRGPPPPAELPALYAAFIDRFRGSRPAIIERVRTYLPVVQAVGAGTAQRPVLDLACGRGEWLEVLHEAQLHARGVDDNPVLIEHCRASGFEVAGGDLLDYLRAAADASYGAVTALHVAEHLGFTALIAVLDEIVRVLAPGGVAIFESPNAYNLLVGACTFHIDPTHHQPLAPDLLRLSRRGARADPGRDPPPAPLAGAAGAAEERSRTAAPARPTSRSL